MIRIRALSACLISGAMAIGIGIGLGQSEPPPQKLDPAAWGSDHVGKSVPEFVAGDVCLFCHRERVGAGWESNRHARTVRPIETEPAIWEELAKSPDPRGAKDEVRYVLGGPHHSRLLKPADSYGHVELFSVALTNGKRVEGGKTPHWDAKAFGESCAGCHATAVNPETRAFAALSLDCGVCHGMVSEDHADNTELVHLSRKRRESARVVASICGQCHIRTGKSRSLSSPYPNNFVAGDNLFRDFQADFSDEALAKLHPADRHAMENLRDIVELGQEKVTCLSCHEIHQASSGKHRRLPRSRICENCHNNSGPMKALKAEWVQNPVHSATCAY